MANSRVYEMSENLANSPSYLNFMMMPIIGAILSKTKKKKEEKTFQEQENLKNAPKGKDPNFTTISPGVARPLKVKDTEADILGKIYNFMRMEHKSYVKGLRADKKYEKKLEKLKEQRTKELIELFAGKKTEKQKKELQKQKKQLEKKEEPKKPEKPEEPKATPAPTAPPKGTPAPTAPPKPTPTPAPTAAPGTKPTPAPKPATPSAPKPAPKPTSPTAPSKVVEIPPVSTATKVGVGVAAAAAAISVYGETGKTKREDIIKKGGQIVHNDPEPGSSSYGIFGMNSAAGTVNQFVLENPQFGFKSKPGTSEFDKEWTNVANQKPEELYNAQLVWYNKNIIEPLKQDLNQSLPVSVSNDDSVLSYMADRRIQYGKTMEQSALKYSYSEDPKVFIDKMTEFDLQNIGKAFSKYLKNHPGAEKGLIKRIENRKKLSLQVGKNVGEQLDQSSRENRTLKKTTEQTSGGSIGILNINRNIVNGGTTYQSSEENTNPSPLMSKQLGQK